MSALARLYVADHIFRSMTNVTVSVAIVSLLGILVSWRFKRYPSVRHCVLLSALIGVLASPILVPAFGAWRVSLFEIPLLATGESGDSAPTVGLSPSVSVDERTIRGPLPANPVPNVADSLPDGSATVAASTAGSPSMSETGLPLTPTPNEQPSWSIAQLTTAIAVAWTAGSVILLLMLLRNWSRLFAIHRSMRLRTDDPLWNLLGEASRAVGCRRDVEVAVSNRIQTPIAMGWFRPCIVIPTRLLEALSNQELRDVLVHECAHVARHDQITIMVQAIVRAVYWPVLPIHWLNRRLADAREELCDNYVLAERTAVDYGETLLRVAKLSHDLNAAMATASIFGWRGRLEDRIADLIHERRSIRTRMNRFAAASVLSLIVLTTCGLCGTKIVPAAVDDAASHSENLANAEDGTLWTGEATFDVAPQAVVQVNESNSRDTGAAQRRAWQNSEYTAPNFEGFFPDDADGGRRLDALFSAEDRDSRSDEEILTTVQNGLRRTSQHRTLILRWIGNRYIWGKSPQNADAIELMYHAADFSGPQADPYRTRHYAVYFGLSVVQPKTPAILRTLVDLCIRVDDPNDLHRVAWGAESQRAELLTFLRPHLDSQDEAVRDKARVVERIFKGELQAFAWAKEESRKRAKAKYTDQLPQIREALVEGDSAARRQVLDLILRDRIMLIMDESWIESFATCAQDADRRVRERVATIVGQFWVWEATAVDPAAVKLMLQLSRDEQRGVRYNAVYFGLSTVRPKDDAVIRRLLELAFEDRERNLYGRIQWGLKADRQRAVELLDEYMAGDDPQHAQHAREVYKDLIGVEARTD